MELFVVKHSVLSGLFAALAALFGKLSTSPSISRSIFSSTQLITEEWVQYSVWVAQSIAIILMIASNAIMWSQYSLALAFSRVTLHVTAVNTVSNFIFTALLGRALFGETISLEWAIGITCIIIGIVLLKEQSDTLTSTDKEKRKHN